MAFAGAAVLLANAHSTFTEYDGLMQLESGRHLVATGHYTGWASHFWPPLYPLLTGLLSHVTDGFRAAKAISVLSAAGSLVVVFALARHLSGSRTVALLAQAALAVNPLFVLNAVQAQNHMLDAMLGVTALWLMIRACGSEKIRWPVMAGLVTGAAISTRYTSVALVAAGLFVTLTRKKSWRAGLLPAGVFCGCVLLTAGPWLVQNWALNGSPFASWQAKNIGSAFLDRSGSTGRWWWIEQARYGGYLDVVRAAPARYLAHVMRNLWGGIANLFGSLGPVALVMPFAVFSRRLDGRVRRVLLLATGTTFLLVVQTFLRDYLFLLWAVTGTALCVAWLGAVAGRFRRRAVVAAVVAALLAPGAVLTVRASHRYLTQYNANATSEVRDVASALRTDGARSRSRVMATHPLYAYAAHTSFVMAPLAYAGNVEDYVRYRGVPPAIARYAPRFPVTMPDGRLGADYLVVNDALTRYLPQFSYLLSHDARRIPRGFTLVYRGRRTVVYRVSA